MTLDFSDSVTAKLQRGSLMKRCEKIANIFSPTLKFSQALQKFGLNYVFVFWAFKTIVKWSITPRFNHEGSTCYLQAWAVSRPFNKTGTIFSLVGNFSISFGLNWIKIESLQKWKRMETLWGKKAFSHICRLQNKWSRLQAYDVVTCIAQPKNGDIFPNLNLQISLFL